MILASEGAKRVLWREMRYGLSSRVLLDFIASLEACFVSWEIITLFMAYGSMALFGLYCFVNLLQKVLIWFNPKVFFQTFFFNKSSSLRSFLMGVDL